jgi:hypothetical protein
MTPVKRVLFVTGGIFWFLFSLGFGFMLVQYVRGDAGLQFFGGPVSSGSVLLGLAHVAGFIAAIVICFAIGAGLCAHGLVLERKHEQDNASSGS